MNHSLWRFVGLAYPYVAMDPALDNERDPTDQDSRTSFPDKDHRSLRGRMLRQRTPDMIDELIMSRCARPVSV